jgi:hypothetical protein
LRRRESAPTFTQVIPVGWLTIVIYLQWCIFQRVQGFGPHIRDECCWHAFFLPLATLMSHDPLNFL